MKPVEIFGDVILQISNQKHNYGKVEITNKPDKSIMSLTFGEHESDEYHSCIFISNRTGEVRNLVQVTKKPKTNLVFKHLQFKTK
jgi:hypothetical protein